MFYLDAFKEACVNACVHNSWIKKTPPAVNVFDNRVEIVSIENIPKTITKIMAGESRSINDNIIQH